VITRVHLVHLLMNVVQCQMAAYRLWNDLQCVKWDVKPCSIQSNPSRPSDQVSWLGQWVHL